VTNSNNNSVTEVNASDGSFVRNLAAGSYNFSSPDALAFDGSHIWVANFTGSITEVNASDGSWVRTASGGGFGFNGPLAVTVAADPIWVGNAGGASLTELPPG
jgi:hypothetical protein